MDLRLFLSLRSETTHFLGRNFGDVSCVRVQDVRLIFAPSVQLVNIALQTWTSCLRVIDGSCETSLRSALIAFLFYRRVSQR